MGKAVEIKEQKTATFVRVVKNKNYTTMSNIHLFNKNLSLKAKGLMSICLALKEDWKYSIAGLVSLSDDGRDSVIAALKSLKEEGFLQIKKERDEKGLFKTIYTFFENPEENPSYEPVSSITENPLRTSIHNGLSDTDYPIRFNRSGLSDTENPQLLNTNNQILKLNTNINTHVKSESDFTAAMLFLLYKQICINFPQPSKLTYKRIKKAEMRIRSHPKKEFWEKVLKNAEKSKFIRESSFFNFDWIIKNDDNAVKVFDGNYNKEEIIEDSSIKDYSNSSTTGKYSSCYKQ